MSKEETEKLRVIIAAIKEGKKGVDFEGLKKCNELTLTKATPTDFFAGLEKRVYTYKHLESLKKGGYGQRNDNNNRGGRGRGARGGYQ